MRFKLSSIVLILGAVSALSSCASEKEAVAPEPAQKKSGYYANPVINRSAPDPTVLRDDDGYYYLYSTEDVRNVPIYRSKNLVGWEMIAKAFTDYTRPQMVPDGGIWAPEIMKFGNKYYLYYSKSKWGGEWECGIGVATANKPYGPFTDQGKLFISSEIGVQNSIDPYVFVDNGTKYLFWGSFRGIYAIELSDDGLSVKPGAEKLRVAGTLTEGTNIIKRDGYYYMLGSAGSCCEGERSTYRVMVARSKNVLGPYVDRDGKSALDNNFTLVLSRSKAVIGPGHNAGLVTDDEGNHWMLYHGFDAAEPNAGRKVYLDRVYWDKEGWPYIKNGQPSEKETVPVIKK